MSPTAFDYLIGGIIVTVYLLLCVVGVVCYRRDRHEPSREEEDRDYHRPARAYNRGEVIKP